MRRLYFVVGMLVGLAALLLVSTALSPQPAGAQLPSTIPGAVAQSQPKHADAEVCTYAVSSSTGSVIVPGTTDIGNSCDDCMTTIVLPFAYQLYDLTFASANVSSNGNVQFVSNSPRSANTCLPALDFDYTIFAQWGDLVTNCFDCGIFTSVSGTAPDRIFNIEWRAMYFEGLPVNFEVRLYEGQTRFDIIYGSIPTGGASATVGVQKSQVSGPVTEYECNTVGTLSDGQQLTFTPATCPAPTSTPTPAPCGLCPAITNVSISCNEDGTVAWTATVHNSSGCNVKENWNSQLQRHKTGNGDFAAVMSTHGSSNFPPGDTTLSGSFCYNAPANIDLIRIRFSLSKRDESGPNGGSSSPGVSGAGLNADDEDCTVRAKSESIAPCQHTGSCPR
ncbi:MAG: hypothetical protein ACJ78Q_05605 [Chloroflexia bacterium]